MNMKIEDVFFLTVPSVFTEGLDAGKDDGCGSVGVNQ
jgi:hypothetical protein